jgi:sugar lactone lactonase YvrE
MRAAQETSAGRRGQLKRSMARLEGPGGGSHSVVVKFFLPICLAGLLIVSRTHADSIVLIAGGGTAEKDAPATQCRLHLPFGVAFSPAGAILLVEMTNGNRLLQIDAHGQLTVLAGTGTKGYSGDGGPAPAATFDGLHTLAAAPDGNVYLADTWNNRVRRYVARTGTVETFAGTGKKGFAGDGGPAREAQFGSVINVALDREARHLYIADIENRRIRRVTLQDGKLETVAGNGTKGVPTDGAIAREAPLVDPRAVTPDTSGGFYVLERSGHALRHVDADGRIRTVAGTGQAGFGGDDGDARNAQLRGPKHLCLDSRGDVLIADTDNHVIRRFSPGTGKISRVAGTGKKGSAGVGGAALSVELNEPHGVAVDRQGRIYIADSANDRVLRIDP